MVSAAWQSFLDEIAHWRDAGLQAEFWWRDDDASRPDPALTRLMKLADSAHVPLVLAVIPDSMQAAAFEPRSSWVSLVQHGADHRNRAAAGEKKTEFPVAEPVAAALERLAQGHARLRSLQGVQVLPVLVPPWNRISSPLLARQLAQAGYSGLSTFGPRRVSDAVPGLRLVNTHVDIIDWRGSRGFVGENLALAQATRHLSDKRAGSADGTEPTGWLTHHAVHDEPAWGFMQKLFERTAEQPGVRWRSAEALFDIRPPA